MDPLQVSMTGVRMGERYLQLFCRDSSLTRGLASKTGLSGVAALAAPDQSHAQRAEHSARKVGALIDVKITTPTTLPWEAQSFDMVVIDETGGDFSALTADARRVALQEAARVLRAGGRVEIIERITSGLLGGARTAPADYAQAGGAEGLLRATGFKLVRTLAERDSFRFVEGIKE